MAGAVDVVHVIIEDAEAAAGGTKEGMMASAVDGGDELAEVLEQGIMGSFQRQRGSRARRGSF
jgi:hypothetical protein